MRAVGIVVALVVAGAIGWWMMRPHEEPLAQPSVAAPAEARQPGTTQPARPTATAPAPVAERPAPAHSSQTLDGTTPAQRFDKGAADPATERRFSPIVERVIAKFDVPHTLECRAGVCKLTTVHEPQKINLWLEALTQDAELLGTVEGNGIQFKPVPPTKDPVSGALLVQEEAFFAVKQ